MVRHTPGPWTATKVPTQVGHAWKFDPVGGCLYVDDRGVERRDPETAEANARLIAAAPALYEALEDVPLPNTNGTAAEFYGRFYDWYEGARRAALSAARPAPTEGEK
jgi:hypothetical protein